jgi:hypothetical protein
MTRLISSNRNNATMLPFRRREPQACADEKIIEIIVVVVLPFNSLFGRNSLRHNLLELATELS